MGGYKPNVWSVSKTKIIKIITSTCINGFGDLSMPPKKLVPPKNGHHIVLQVVYPFWYGRNVLKLYIV